MINRLLPDDAFNRQLVANVHPPEWVNPIPDGRYNLVVIGAGTAGLVTAAVGAGIGARVALVERHLMGGDCLNVGCVPSKGIIRAARVWASAQEGAEFGLTFPGRVERDFGAAMARMRRLRAAISHVDSAERYKGLGVDVFIGEARFTGRDVVRVGDAALRFARAAVCTGARATALPIPGLAEAGFLTNETVFSLTALPRRLAVIGAGPIGCELAQAFARFGSEVTVFELTPHILQREDPDAAAVVQARMERDGVRFAFDTTIDRVEPATVDERDGNGKRIRYTTAGDARETTVDEILVGVGRAPNVEGLGLEEAGVSYDRSGVRVDAHLRTSNPRIYAAGDIC
ncbi:MAG: FAD-dependent oxidoreductase, partial [Acidobacteria bacterium]|nr:FAD-dependent oxidoreductase [Acidobacteriota bacterium]